MSGPAFERAVALVSIVASLGWLTYAVVARWREVRAAERHRALVDRQVQRTVDDLAAGMGITREHAARALSKALGTPVQPLARVGIAFRAPWYLRPWYRLLSWWEDHRG